MSDTLRCTTCQRDLPDDDFSMDRKPCRRKRRFRRYECRECVSTRWAIWGERIRQVANAAKDVPCMDCGVRYPLCATDFDHVRGKKLFGLNDATSHSLQKVKDEIAKCDVVCANCHADRTYKSKQYLHPDGRSWTSRRSQTPSPSLPDALTLF